VESLKVIRRHLINSKSKRSLINRLNDLNLPPVISKKMEIELVELERVTLYFFGEDILLIETSDFLVPSLKALKTIENVSMPFVVVDTGAIRFVVKGADVMRPGIVEISSDVKKNQLTLVLEENNKASIAIGTALFDYSEMNQMTSGKVVKNFHHLTDEYWTFNRSLL
jgi:PUA domain protein